MISIILILLLSLLILIYVNLSQKVKRTNTKGLGLSSLYSSRVAITNRLFKFVDDNKIRTGLIHFWLGPRLCLMAIDPESAKFVLKTPQFQKINFLSGKKLRNSFGKNLVILDGEEWRHHRNIVNSGFNSKAYSSYYPIFVETIEKALSIMTKDLSIDINCGTLFSKFTLDLLGKSIFHHDFGQLDNIDNKYFHAYKTILGISNSSKIGVLMSLFPWLENFPIKQIKELNDSIDLMISLFNSIIKERKEGTSKGDILDHLLEASELSPVELISEIWIFFLAGHETTATALTWACVCLAHYPDIQEKLAKEIISVLGTEKTPSIDELSHLYYLDCFIDEVLRLHPPVRLLPTRTAVEDVTYGNYFIPKGTIIGICIEVIHKNPDIWPDPEKFDPDRFLSENKKGRNHFSFLPFSLGHRQCIGNNFSLIEQKLFLSKLLQKYKVLPPVKNPPFDLSQSLDFGSDKECFVRLEIRDK